MIFRLFVSAAVLGIGAANVFAQTIYPLDRAEILVGSRFDLKVEFAALTDPTAIKITVNGGDAATAATAGNLRSTTCPIWRWFQPRAQIRS